MDSVNWEILVDRLTNGSFAGDIDFNGFSGEDLREISRYIDKVIEFRCELLRGGDPASSLYNKEREKLLKYVGLSQEEVARLTRLVTDRTKNLTFAEMLRSRCKPVVG